MPFKERYSGDPNDTKRDPFKHPGRVQSFFPVGGALTDESDRTIIRDLEERLLSTYNKKLIELLCASYGADADVEKLAHRQYEVKLMNKFFHPQDLYHLNEHLEKNKILHLKLGCNDLYDEHDLRPTAHIHLSPRCSQTAPIGIC